MTAEDVLVVRNAQTDADAVIGEAIESVCGHFRNLGWRCERAAGDAALSAGVRLLGHLGSVGSAAAFALAAVLSFAAVVAALTAALALAVVFPFTGVLGGFVHRRAAERQFARLQDGR